MKTKFFILLTFLCVKSKAQLTSSDYDFNKIQLTVGIPEQLRTEFPEEAINLLETKLINMVLGSGLGSTSTNPHFILWPRISILQKENTSTAPIMIIQELEITLLVGDYVNGTMVHRKTITVKGVGTNETKSLIDAFKKINPDKKDLKEFTDESRKKIVEYYENSCADVISKANAFIHQKRYEEAISVCMEVPAEVSSCYSRVEEKAFEAYKLFSNQNCKENLVKAKAAKATNDFQTAVYYIGLIDPTSSCAKESEQLIKEMEKKLNEKEKRDWDFMLKQYNDDIALKKLRIKNIKQFALPSFIILRPNLLENFFLKFR